MHLFNINLVTYIMFVLVSVRWILTWEKLCGVESREHYVLEASVSYRHQLEMNKKAHTNPKIAIFKM